MNHNNKSKIMTTSKLMKAVRKESGLTQSQMALKVSTTVPMISGYENGKHSISLDKFLNICQILNIEPKTLF